MFYCWNSLSILSNSFFCCCSFAFPMMWYPHPPPVPLFYICFIPSLLYGYNLSCHCPFTQLHMNNRRYSLFLQSWRSKNLFFLTLLFLSPSPPISPACLLYSVCKLNVPCDRSCQRFHNPDIALTWKAPVRMDVCVCHNRIVFEQVCMMEA